MTESDRPAFGTAVTAMLETFGQEATKARLMGYWIGLGDLDLDELESAVGRAIQTLSRTPVPAELRAMARGTSEEAETAAWLTVERAMPLGAYRHVSFADAAINAAIRSLGGWPRLFERCRDADGEKWYRIEFTKAYRTFRARGCSGEVSAPLPGLSEANVVDGKRSEPRITWVGEDGAVRQIERRVTSNPRARRLGAGVELALPKP